jgi:hypothetical protein
MEDDEYSAVLEGPRNQAEYCPSCNSRAPYRLCRKCKDEYVCAQCGYRGVCEGCVITCFVCHDHAIRADCSEDICEECEHRLECIPGDFVDDEGHEHQYVTDLILIEATGVIYTDESIDDDLMEYLNEIGIRLASSDEDS